MKPLKAFFFIAVLFFSFAIGGSTLAAGPIDSSGSQSFEIHPKGPISVDVGELLRLRLRIKNIEPEPAFLSRITVVVIEPFNGTRLHGPIDYWVGQSIAAGDTIFREISLGSFDASYQDLSAGAIIFAIGSNNEANGYSGWGFVIK